MTVIAAGWLVIRLDPLVERRARLQALVSSAASPVLRFSERLKGDGPTSFRHTCAMA
jgi:ATP-dependent DNA ligase